MDCPHFPNYFVQLIYNSKLLQSAVKARQKLIAFAKSIHYCCLYSAEGQKIRFTSSSQTHCSQHKQDDVMQRINIVIPRCLICTHSTSGNKWESEHAVRGLIVSSPLGFSNLGCSHHEPPMKPLLLPSWETPILNTSVQNMMNVLESASGITSPPA